MGFTGLPYTDHIDGLLKCNANWLFPLSRATHWYTNEPGDDTVIDLINVVSTGVVMLPISPSNMSPSQRKKRGYKKGRYNISEDSHYFIGDEILLRERLEYDPSILFGCTDK